MNLLLQNFQNIIFSHKNDSNNLISTIISSCSMFLNAMCLSNHVKLETKQAKTTISELWHQGQNNAKDG